MPHDFNIEILKNKLEEKAPSDLSSLTQQIKALQGQIKELQGGTTIKKYTLEDICPYLFDRSLNMIPFPKNCEMPKFDLYNGKSDPIDHVRDF